MGLFRLQARQENWASSSKIPKGCDLRIDINTSNVEVRVKSLSRDCSVIDPGYKYSANRTTIHSHCEVFAVSRRIFFNRSITSQA